MDIFSIPEMGSECERVFSQFCRLITFERTRLGDDTIESDECQKHWLASGCLALSDTVATMRVIESRNNKERVRMLNRVTMSLPKP